jgi:hypothetical protein
MAVDVRSQTDNGPHVQPRPVEVGEHKPLVLRCARRADRPDLEPVQWPNDPDELASTVDLAAARAARCRPREPTSRPPRRSSIPGPQRSQRSPAAVRLVRDRAGRANRAGMQPNEVSAYLEDRADRTCSFGRISGTQVVVHLMKAPGTGTPDRRPGHCPPSPCDPKGQRSASTPTARHPAARCPLSDRRHASLARPPHGNPALLAGPLITRKCDRVTCLLHVREVTLGRSSRARW